MSERTDTSLREPRRGFHLSRKHFYLLLTLCFLFPLLPVLNGSRGLILAVFMTFWPAVVGAFFCVRIFERGLQEKVALLVQAKVESAGAVTHVLQEKSEEELKKLRTALEECRRGYEHQIDLLQSSCAKSKERAEELEFDLEKKREELHFAKRDCEDGKRELRRLQEEGEHFNVEREEQFKAKESLLGEYQQTIHEQRGIIEKKQRTIARLEGKVRDLMYEIRSLLQLEGEAPPELPEQREDVSKYYLPTPSSPVEITTSYDLTLVLKKYIEMTETFPSLGNKEGQGSRFLDLSLERNAIDLRRLFDSFREETCGILFFYSLLEGKFLFVNQQVKIVLGWSPEKLAKDFPQLMVAGHSQWGEALKSLGDQRESTCALALRSKGGQELRLQCFMGVVTEGPFQHHAVGLFSPL